MPKKRPSVADNARNLLDKINNDPHAAELVQRPRRNAASAPADLALEGRPVPLRQPVTIRFDAELLGKVKDYLAKHLKETRRRIYLQDVCEEGLRLWAQARGIK